MITLITKVIGPMLTPSIIASVGAIDESTVVPLTIVCGVASVCWYLNGRLTRIEWQLFELQHRFDSFCSKQRNKETKDDE